MILKKAAFGLIVWVLAVSCASEVSDQHELIDFPIPDGFQLDLFYFSKEGTVSFRRELTSGKYAGIAFRKGYSEVDMSVLKEVGFKDIEGCEKQNLMAKDLSGLYEFTGFVADDIYIHAVNISRDEVSNLKDYLCN